MRRVFHLLVLVVIVLSVRACGVNDTYDRLRAGSRWAMEKTGL